MTSSTIHNAYMRLWCAFVDAANAQTLRAEGLGPLVSTANGVTIATAMFFLKGWPYKAVSHHKDVDIAVDVQEVFSRDLKRVMKATTRVGHFVLDRILGPPA